MTQAPIIVLLGSSVFMDGVSNCLVNERTIKAVRFDDITTCCQADFCSLLPDIIVFELESMPVNELFRRMPDYPDVQWVALDSRCSQVFVMNSRRYATKTMNNLLHVIHDIVPGTEGGKGGKWAETTKRAFGVQE